MKKAKELIIDKSNILTDAKTGDIRLFDDKIINILYYIISSTYHERIVINLLDIKKLLGIKSNDYIELILGSLERLDKNKVSLRDFTYKGKKISWIRSSVIKEMIIFEESRSKLEIEVSRTIIDGLRQKKNFTPLDINICNQFKTKYGLKLYELYKRYETLNSNNKTYNIDRVKEGIFILTINEAVERFGVDFKYPSEWLKSFNRGIKEIKDITSADIGVFYDKREKTFLFKWQRDESEVSLKQFKKYIRINYINQLILKEYTVQSSNKPIQLSVSEYGKLYDRLGNNKINYESSVKIWKWLYENQEQILKGE